MHPTPKMVGLPKTGFMRVPPPKQSRNLTYVEIAFSPKLTSVKTENVANITSVKFQNAPKIRHFPTEILIVQDKNFRPPSAALVWL